VPQNGRIISGFLLDDFLQLSRFLDAFDRHDTTATLSKSNSPRASSKEHESFPSLDKCPITSNAKSTPAERIPRSTAADIDIEIILDFFFFFFLICFNTPYKT
jgi:hypothetical protein